VRWLRRGSGGQDHTAAAERMVRSQIEARGVRDAAVLDALRRVPRHRFVPDRLSLSAYSDNALPIGRGQTISQPFIVALMTEALALTKWRAAHADRPPKVLDVGTGSGYQAAVLAELGAEVISIERDAELAATAERVLHEIGYEVKVLVGDGSAGVPAEAPFAAIVVAAAAPSVPAPLVEQLERDGRLVLPIGGRLEQQLVVVAPTDEGFSTRPLEAAVFVPLVGQFGFGDDPPDR
jgi:protein-L-isoaspartate(D-aspartate) O-methyltransferase